MGVHSLAASPRVRRSAPDTHGRALQDTFHKAVSRSGRGLGQRPDNGRPQRQPSARPGTVTAAGSPREGYLAGPQAPTPAQRGRASHGVFDAYRAPLARASRGDHLSAAESGRAGVPHCLLPSRSRRQRHCCASALRIRIRGGCVRRESCAAVAQKGRNPLTGGVFGPIPKYFGNSWGGARIAYNPRDRCYTQSYAV